MEAENSSASGTTEVLDYAFAPRLLNPHFLSSGGGNGSRQSRGITNTVTSYPHVSPKDGRTRLRIACSQLCTMSDQPMLVDPRDWSLDQVMCLDREEVARRDMGEHGNFVAGLTVVTAEMPDPGTGGKGRTVLLLGTDTGSILAFDGESESCDYLGAVGSSLGPCGASRPITWRWTGSGACGWWRLRWARRACGTSARPRPRPGAAYASRGRWCTS
jgi:hypothetical protein